MIWVIDDQQLSNALRTGQPPPPVAVGDHLYTTGYWYVRLCQAVLGAVERKGVLSAPFAELPANDRQRALEALLELPTEIGLISLRDLGPAIGRLRQRHQLNILSMEALAAAVHLSADVVLSAPSPQLEQALEAEGRSVTLASAGRSNG